VWRDVPLKLGLNEYYDYTVPVNVDYLGPNFVYYGFIPAHLARNKNEQGIQVGATRYLDAHNTTSVIGSEADNPHLAPPPQCLATPLESPLSDKNTSDCTFRGNTPKIFLGRAEPLDTMSDPTGKANTVFHQGCRGRERQGATTPQI